MRARKMAFGLWTAAIFALSPCARILEAFVYERIGVSVLAESLCLLGAVVFGMTCRLLWQRHSSPRAFFALAAGSAAYGVIASQLSQSPDEIFHLFEHGFLSFLCSRVLAARSDVWTANLSAAFIAASIGIAEELFQWALPNRVFDLRDITLNFLSAFIVQLALIAGRAERRPVTTVDLRSLFSSTLIFTLMLLLCALLTPPTVRRIAIAAPFLSFLQDEAVVDFGYECAIEEETHFVSHFVGPVLAALDRRRGREVEETLAHRTGDRDSFLRAHSETRDPFLNEAEVHLFRRDVYLQRFAANPSDRSSATVAFNEEKILEAFFPNSVSHALLRGQAREQLQSSAEIDGRYNSPVSRNIIVAFSDIGLQAFLAAVCLIVALVRFNLGRMQR